MHPQLDAHPAGDVAVLGVCAHEFGHIVQFFSLYCRQLRKVHAAAKLVGPYAEFMALAAIEEGYFWGRANADGVREAARFGGRFRQGAVRMSARLGLAGAALALLVLDLASSPALAQERERRCYFGECPEEDSPQLPPPRDYTPPAPGPDAGNDATAGAADDLPHFCCTVMGPLGPYPNPGPYGVAPVGSLCSGVAMDGLVYQGTTCYGDEQPSAVTAPAPSFCCTLAGRFGPFPNPGWPEGSPCWSQTLYGPVQGLACY